MRRLNHFSLISFICVVLLAISAPSWGADTIKIGIIGPMKFSQGKEQWNGAEMAADEINSEGGVKVGNRRLKVQIIQADSNEFINIADATNAMEKLILRDKVDFVVGGFRSEAVLAMQDIAMDNKMLFIGSGPAHPELCLRVAKDYNRYKYWFRGAVFNSTYLVKNLFAQTRSVATDLKKNLDIDRIKIAIVAEKAMWADGMVKAAEAYLPMMGMEVVGVWRPSANATDVTAELTAIQRVGCHIILTMISGPAGIPLAKQAGELKIPAVQVGINVVASRDSFWEATQGMANYVMHQNTYCPGAEYNDLTKPFVDEYIKRYGQVPGYTAATHGIIKVILAKSIEKAQSLNPEKLIPIIENDVHKLSSGYAIYEKDTEGHPLHDLKYGPGYLTSLGVQWQDGKQVAVWPHFKWVSPYWEYSVEPPDQPNKLSYKGLQPYVIPPWVVAAYKK